MEKCKRVYHRYFYHGAEFVTCFEATIYALWLGNFILGLNVVDIQLDH